LQEIQLDYYGDTTSLIEEDSIEDDGDGDNNIIDGLHAEIIAGNYEVIPSDQIQGIWDLLLTQKPLSSKSIDKNIQISNKAWNFGRSSNKKKNNEEKIDHHQFVFQTDIKVSELSDDAHRCWIATVLLGDTTLRRRYSSLE